MDRKLGFLKKNTSYWKEICISAADDLFDNKKISVVLYNSLPNSSLTLSVEEYYPLSAILKTKDTSKVPFSFISVTHPVFAS